MHGILLEKICSKNISESKYVCIHQENGDQSKSPQPFTVCSGAPDFRFQNTHVRVHNPSSENNRVCEVATMCDQPGPIEPLHIRISLKEDPLPKGSETLPGGYGWVEVSVHIIASPMAGRSIDTQEQQG